jgi:hypothetical protein
MQAQPEVSNDKVEDVPEITQQDGKPSGVALNADEDENQEIKTETPEQVSYVEPKPEMQSDSMIHEDQEDKEQVSTLSPALIEPAETEKEPTKEVDAPQQEPADNSEVQHEPSQDSHDQQPEYQHEPVDSEIQHEPTHDETEPIHDDTFEHEPENIVHEPADHQAEDNVPKEPVSTSQDSEIDSATPVSVEQIESTTQFDESSQHDSEHPNQEHDESEKEAEKESDKEAENESEKEPEKESEKVPEKVSENVPVTESEKETEKESEKESEPAITTEAQNEVSTDKAPEALYQDDHKEAEIVGSVPEHDHQEDHDESQGEQESTTPLPETDIKPSDDKPSQDSQAESQEKPVDQGTHGEVDQSQPEIHHDGEDSELEDAQPAVQENESEKEQAASTESSVNENQTESSIDEEHKDEVHNDHHEEAAPQTEIPIAGAEAPEKETFDHNQAAEELKVPEVTETTTEFPEAELVTDKPAEIQYTGQDEGQKETSANDGQSDLQNVPEKPEHVDNIHHESPEFASDDHESFDEDEHEIEISAPSHPAHEENANQGTSDVSTESNVPEVGSEKEKDENDVHVENIPVEDVAEDAPVTEPVPVEISTDKPGNVPESISVIEGEENVPSQDIVTETIETKPHTDDSQVTDKESEKEPQAIATEAPDTEYKPTTESDEPASENNVPFEHPIEDEVEGDHHMIENEPHLEDSAQNIGSSEPEQADGATSPPPQNELLSESVSTSEAALEQATSLPEQTNQGENEISTDQPLVTPENANAPHDAHYSIVETITKPPMESDSLVHDKVPQMEIEKTTEKQEAAPEKVPDVSSVFEEVSKLPSISNLTPNHPAMQDMEEVNHHEEMHEDFGHPEQVESHFDEKEDEKVAEVQPADNIQSNEEVTESGDISTESSQESLIPGEG